jgi:CheY-like chemotaxis protein
MNMTRQIVLIEDDHATRDVYHEILSRMSFDVIDIADGQTALDVLSSSAPNVIILDLLLPKISGIDVLDFIYSTPHLSSSPVIIFSAHDHLLRTPLRQGDIFLLKPVSPRVVREAIERAVSSNQPL